LGRRHSKRRGADIAGRKTAAVLIAMCAAVLVSATWNWSGRSGGIASTEARAAAVSPAGVPAPADSGPRLVDGTSAPYSGEGRVGESAPDLEFLSLGGDRVSLASLRGRAVLLNLWATWCAPCLGEMPELSALHHQYVDNGLVVVGMNVDSAARSDNVRAFVSERNIPFAVWLDPKMRTANALRVNGLPATFVLDRNGRIVMRRIGPITARDRQLQQALESATNSPLSSPSRARTTGHTDATAPGS